MNCLYMLPIYPVKSFPELFPKGFRFLHFPGGIVSPNHKYVVFDWASQVALKVKNPPANEGDTGSIPGSGRSPGGEHGNPLQYSCLENPMDSGVWQATVHGVAKSRTRLQCCSTRQYLILSAIRSKSSATRDLFWVGFFTLHQMV